MTSQEVIKLGQQILEPTHPSYFNSYYFLVPVIITLCLLILLIHFGAYFKTVIDATTFVFSISVALSFFGFLFNDNYSENIIKHTKEIADWREEIVYPYIESLPPLERELDTVILNTTEMKTGTYIDKLPLIISYTKNGKTITTSGVYPIEKSLADGEKPHLNYKRLNTELGHNVNKGDYFEKVILPKNFKLEPSSN
jgi:hypothetical protein